jgi:hypothetical protein
MQALCSNIQLAVDWSYETRTMIPPHGGIAIRLITLCGARLRYRRGALADFWQNSEVRCDHRS